MPHEAPKQTVRHEQGGYSWMEKRKAGIAALGKDVEAYGHAVATVLPFWDEKQQRIVWPGKDVLIHGLSGKSAQLIKELREADTLISTAPNDFRSARIYTVDDIADGMRDSYKEDQKRRKSNKEEVQSIPIPKPSAIDILDTQYGVLEGRWKEEAHELTIPQAFALPKEVSNTLQNAREQLMTLGVRFSEHTLLDTATALDNIAKRTDTLGEQLTTFQSKDRDALSMKEGLVRIKQASEALEEEMVQAHRELTAATDRIGAKVQVLEQEEKNSYERAKEYGLSPSKTVAVSVLGKNKRDYSNLLLSLKAITHSTNEYLPTYNRYKLKDGTEELRIRQDGLFGALAIQAQRLLKADETLASAAQYLDEMHAVHKPMLDRVSAMRAAQKEAHDIRKRIKGAQQIAPASDPQLVETSSTPKKQDIVEPVVEKTPVKPPVQPTQVVEKKPEPEKTKPVKGKEPEKPKVKERRVSPAEERKEKRIKEAAALSSAIEAIERMKIAQKNPEQRVLWEDMEKVLESFSIPTKEREQIKALADESRTKTQFGKKGQKKVLEILRAGLLEVKKGRR